MPGDVFLLGHRGMLGHVVARVFESAGYCLRTSNDRFEGELEGGLLADVQRAGCRIVINCIGTTPARTDARSLWLTNTLLPQALAARSGGALLIHASSDGVFDGARGGYGTDAPPDAEDLYGLSKRLGELCLALGPVVILRTSVVGPEPVPRSLLAWYLAQAAPVRGFVNQKWNGITSLSWAQCALRAARGELAAGLHQPTCATPVTKFELLTAIRDAFGGGPDIVETLAATPLDRTLAPTIRLAPIQQQLAELKAWYCP
jgi:dTDP-4-dehydrorhamnose reductase